MSTEHAKSGADVVRPGTSLRPVIGSATPTSLQWGAS